MTKLSTALFASVLGALSASTVRAADITITLDTTVLRGAPGDTITFSGFLTNLDNAQVDLIGCTANLPGLFVFDCTPFFTNAPLFLNPNEVTASFDLFTVTIQSPFTDPFTRYHGDFTVDGGIDVGGSSPDGAIGEVGFDVDVVPEPGTAGMLGIAAAGFAFMRLRRRD